MTAMAAYLEMWGATGASMVPLDGDRITLGSADSNDLAVPTDRRLSRMHAVFERYPAGWCVRDLGSRNGTFVNGQRVWQERALVDGDEIRAGASRFVLRSRRAAAVSANVSLMSPFCASSWTISTRRPVTRWIRERTSRRAILSPPPTL